MNIQTDKQDTCGSLPTTKINNKPFPAVSVLPEQSICERFRQAMADFDISINCEIIADGNIHRFHIEGDKRNSKNGWYMLFNSETPGGVFGSWKTGIQQTWSFKTKSKMNRQEREEFKRHMSDAKKEIELEKAKKAKKAQRKACQIWENSTKADTKFPYLKRKGIKPYGIRKSKYDQLVIPLYDIEGLIKSLQFINKDGSKRFLPGGETKGNYFLFGNKESDKVYICEGYATGASIYEATKGLIVIAFNAGNLVPVSKAIKTKHPTKKLIICADNDQWTKDYVDNPGVTKATEAAETIDAALAIPNFKTLDNQPTDFNDLAIREGHETVRQQIEKAFQQVTIQDTPSPVLLDAFNLSELKADIIPGSIGEMVEAVIDATETPRELASMLAISVLGACCQKTFSIMPEEGYFEPLNIWTLAALEPGNRKSSVMKMMTSPLMEWEKDKAHQLEPEIKRITAKRENQEARIRSLRSLYAKAKEEDLIELEYEIQEMNDSMPDIPRVPQVWTQDITPEHLGTLMFENGEKAAILSSEGGIFDIMAGRYSGGIPNLDIFLQSHAGDPVRVDRGNRQPIYMQHPALTMGLSPQPDVLHGLSSKQGFRGRGLLARFLYVLPFSPIGFRKLSTQPVPKYVMRIYEDNIKALLEIKPYTDHQMKNSSYILKLSKSAWQEWKEFSLNLEKDMREGERFEYMTDWASKLPGAVARIAGLFHCAEYAHNRPWEHEVEKHIMNKTLAMAAILSEHAQAVFGLIGADQDLEAARKVWRWIERKRLSTFTARDCFDALKGTFKRMEKIRPAFKVLIERYYISEMENKKKLGRPSQIFAVNPKQTAKWQ